MTPGLWIRYATVAFSVAAVQALMLDGAHHGPIAYLDLPLVVVIVLATLRPDGAVATGFLFGLIVDLFGTRLFGVHALSYCVLGVVVTIVPVGALRTRLEAISCLVAAQAVVAISIVTAALVLTGGLPADTAARYVQTTAWTLVVAVPLIAASGAQIGLVTPEPQPLGGPASSADWA